MEKNVIYGLIVYWQKSGYRIIAEYSISESSIYRDVILEVMRSTITTDEERIGIQRGDYTVHLLIGELHYAALTLTPDGLASSSILASTSQIFLDRLRCVYRELPIIADLSRNLNDFYSIVDLSLPLKNILEEFNRQECDILPILEDNLTEIRRVLMDNVQKLIDRGQKLDDLIRKAQKLEITARTDFRRAQKSSIKKRNVIITISVVILMSLAIIFSMMAIIFFYG